jgi:hypothetical protein
MFISKHIMINVMRVYIRFLIGFGIILPICSLYAQIDSTWWYDHYSKGLFFLNENQLDSAQMQFRQILDKDDEIAYAYYGLGMTYDKMYEDIDEAIEQLEEAIDLDPEFIDAYYYLGLLYESDGSGSSSKECFQSVVEKNPYYTIGWIALARVEENFQHFLEMPSDSKPLKILSEGLKYNPHDRAIYEHFKKYVFWYAYEELSLPTFEFLIEENSSESIYMIDYARAMYNLDRLDFSLKLLDSVEVFYTDYSQVEIDLLRSKILFNRDKTEKGLSYYWRAVDGIKNLHDRAHLFSDISYIMLDSEYDNYLMTSDKELPDFYRRFWLSRDPNLATEMNERIAEHYIRLKYAKNNYRRFNPGFYKMVTVYKLDHPFFGRLDVKLGDELSDPFISSASLLYRDIDDRGLIYIRHGEPDNTAFFNCMNCPQNMSWQYHDQQNHGELIFHFSKHSEQRGWFLESTPYTFAERGDFGGFYFNLDPTMSRNIDFYRESYRYEELNKKSIKNVEVGLKTETSAYVYENDLIEFPLDYLCFKDKNFQTEVCLFYGLEGDNVELQSGEPYGNILYSVFLGLFDNTWDEIFRESFDRRIPISVEQDEWEESTIVELENFSILPGEYNFEFQLQDKISNNLGVYKGTVFIPDYSSDSLMLSDILLSGPVSRESNQAIFRKGDVEYSPHMFTAYNNRETIGIYIEIYNLLFDFNDRSSFEVTWVLNEVEEDESDAIKSSLQYSGNTRDDKIYLNLELSDTDSGEYELLISVKDMISQKEASKNTRVSVR